MSTVTTSKTESPSCFLSQNRSPLHHGECHVKTLVKRHLLTLYKDNKVSTTSLHRQLYVKSTQTTETTRSQLEQPALDNEDENHLLSTLNILSETLNAMDKLVNLIEHMNRMSAQADPHLCSSCQVLLRPQGVPQLIPAIIVYPEADDSLPTYDQAALYDPSTRKEKSDATVTVSTADQNQPPLSQTQWGRVNLLSSFAAFTHMVRDTLRPSKNSTRVKK